MVLEIVFCRMFGMGIQESMRQGQRRVLSGPATGAKDATGRADDELCKRLYGAELHSKTYHPPKHNSKARHKKRVRQTTKQSRRVNR